MGSEIEAAVGQSRKAAWAAFKEDERPDPQPTIDDIRDEVEKTVPHAVTYADQVTRMREWAEKNAQDANDHAADQSTAVKKKGGKSKRARPISV